jgi:hypothetical protein
MSSYPAITISVGVRGSRMPTTTGKYLILSIVRAVSSYGSAERKAFSGLYRASQQPAYGKPDAPRGTAVRTFSANEHAAAANAQLRRSNGGVFGYGRQHSGPGSSGPSAPGHVVPQRYNANDDNSAFHRAWVWPRPGRFWSEWGRSVLFLCIS